MSQVNDFIQYIITKGFNEEDAIIWVKDLEKGGKLTLPAVNQYLDCKRRIAESKEDYPVKEKSNFGKKFIDSRSDYKIDIEDFNESEALKLNCKQDCKQGKPVDNIQVNQVNLPNNCFIGFKVNQVVFDKIKHQSEQSGIPISAIMRDVAEHNF